MNRAVVYYSLSGNTKEAAKVIARKLGAKIFESHATAACQNLVYY